MSTTKAPKPDLLCPLCKDPEKTAATHCESSTCDWIKCHGKNCDAVLAPTQGRGHCIDPQATVQKPKRMRVILDEARGEWREHIGG